MRPVLCMITDRGRFESEPHLAGRVAWAARNGVHLIQVRERDLEARPLLGLVGHCVEAARRTGARVVVNDRLDVALAAGAHGVHLRGDSMPASRVRAIAPPGFLIGRSVHSRDEAVRAAGEGGLDYLVFGPVFATSSKPGAAAAGVEALAAVAAATALPVLAVGGVTAGQARELARTGAAGCAAIGLFAERDLHTISAALSSLRSAFDSLRPLP